MGSVEQFALEFDLTPPRRIYTVGELNAAIRAALDAEFREVWVSGEISGLKLAASGHYYFTLKEPEAQEASRHLDEWRAAGIAHFRLEFAHESAEQVTGISGAFADCLAGRIGAKELGQELRRLTPHGTTEGSLFVPQGYQELPILQ